LQDLYRPDEVLYFLPIGGTATAPLAGLLREMGHRIEGVDSQLYPPMSTLLEELGIPVRIGFDPDSIPGDVERVIIGNAVPRTNPEVAAVLARRLPHISQAEAVAHYVLASGLRSLVVAGTHGKTTTSAMLAWILERNGADPSYLIGGLPLWNRRGFRHGAGEWLVIEGDEYNAAFFDRGPKFLHYRPHVFVIGPVEYDHADLYPNLDAVLTAFRAGAALVPRDGAVVVNAWSEHALAACRDATASIVTVGPGADCVLQVGAISGGPLGSRATVRWQDHELLLHLAQPGAHLIHDAAVAVAAALAAGSAFEDAVAAMADFPGVARRMEVVGEAGGVTVVDDFAHHPTALAATVSAARQRWPGRRLVVAFEPRSLTAARREFAHAYAEALGAADVVLVAPPYHAGRLAADEVLDRDDLAAVLADTGVDSVMPGPEEDPLSGLLAVLRQGDVVLVCSSGDFGGLHRRLVCRLRTEGAG
jgi:UDP-N-acetylmuramate: L-alanyl-gamma-D-glutamyl-meso-diaminopimelate ligase